MWRFSGRGSLRPGYPAPASQMFGFPRGLENIDAVYERTDGNIIFFTGDSFWISNGNSFIGNTITNPFPLSCFFNFRWKSKAINRLRPAKQSLKY